MGPLFLEQSLVVSRWQLALPQRGEAGVPERQTGEDARPSISLWTGSLWNTGLESSWASIFGWRLSRPSCMLP